MVQSKVDEFSEKIESLYEVEYGDFKRKVTLYIDRLEEDLEQNKELDSHWKNKIERMKTLALYSSVPNIEMVRGQLLDVLKKKV